MKKKIRVCDRRVGELVWIIEGYGNTLRILERDIRQVQMIVNNKRKDKQGFLYQINEKYPGNGWERDEYNVFSTEEKAIEVVIALIQMRRDEVDLELQEWKDKLK